MMNFKEINLDKVLKYTQPTRYIVESTDYDDKFETPVLTAGKNFLLGHTNEKKGIYKDVPAIIFDDFTTSFHFVDFPFKVKSSALKILNTRNNQFDIKYVYYLMRGVKIDTQLHKRYWISRFSKKSIPIPYQKSEIKNPSLETQKQIAQILDNAAALSDKTKKLLAEYDQLAQSLFLDMFGDPVTNPKAWKKQALKKLGETITGNTPKRSEIEFYGDYIEWVKTDNINTSDMYLTKAEEYLSEKGLSKGRKVDEGAILVTCIAGSRKVIGNVSIANRSVSFNQQINAFKPFNSISFFWYHHFISAKKYIQNH